MAQFYQHMEYHITKLDCYRLVATDGEREAYWNKPKEKFSEIQMFKKDQYEFHDLEKAIAVIDTPESDTLEGIDKRRIPRWTDRVEVRAYGASQNHSDIVEVKKFWKINRPWSRH